MLDELVALAERVPPARYRELVAGLGLARRSAPGQLEAMVYEPLVCLILQGEKRTRMGGQELVAGPGRLILVSHAMPVVSQISVATTGAPYLSLVARLDLAELRLLSEQIQLPPMRSARAFSVAAVGPALLEVFRRYLALAGDEEAAAVLAPVVRRELHYRLLKSTAGALLHPLLHHESHASSIAQAIGLLRQSYRQHWEMEELARAVGMSPSSFYKHFRATTATTPLRYLKQLRLTEARRLLVGGDHSVSMAAFAVGYESPSQFSREYSRTFGAPPRTDRPGAAR